MKRKTYFANLKTPGSTGDFEAVFASLNVVDYDGDLTEPGAFGRQDVIVEPWNHNYGELPVGRGTIFERGSEAVVKGRFFLDTTSGRDHYQAIKNLAELCEWSYSFSIIKQAHGIGEETRRLLKLKVFGVGPVTKGAGIDTRTVAIKAGRSHRGLDTVSSNPRVVQRQIKALADSVGLRDSVKAGRSYLGLGTVSSNPRVAQWQIEELADSMGLRDSVLRYRLEKLQAECVDFRIADLKAVLARQRPSAKQTNRDRVHAAIVAQYGRDHSEQWLEMMVGIYLDDLAMQIVRRQESQAGITPSYAFAVEQVQHWAGQPASS